MVPSFPAEWFYSFVSSLILPPSNFFQAPVKLLIIRLCISVEDGMVPFVHDISYYHGTMP